MGVRVPDVSWGSDGYVQKHIREVFASNAPEICVEIISPSNTQEEMLDKIRLFISAGAREVWLVTEDGSVSFYDETGKVSVSFYDINLNNLI